MKHWMPAVTSNLSGPVNYVFVDFENVHEIDLSIIGGKAVNFTLLLGPRQTKLDVSLVERILEHAAAAQLVRLASPGRNALDFTLSYYVGRAVAADPTGIFHVVSKDTGFDPLIEHLQGKNIRALRHDNFSTLPFSGPAKPPAPAPPAPAPKLKPEPKPKPQPPSIQDEREAKVLEHLRKASTKRPRSRGKLVSYLVAHLGHKITEAEALQLVEHVSQAGHLFIDDKGTVTYHMAAM